MQSPPMYYVTPPRLFAETWHKKSRAPQFAINTKSHKQYGTWSYSVFSFFFHTRQGEIGFLSEAPSWAFSRFLINLIPPEPYQTQWWSSLDYPAGQTLSYEVGSESLIFFGPNIRGPTNPESIRGCGRRCYQRKNCILCWAEISQEWMCK